MLREFAAFCRSPSSALLCFFRQGQHGACPPNEHCGKIQSLSGVGELRRVFGPTILHIVQDDGPDGCRSSGVDRNRRKSRTRCARGCRRGSGLLRPAAANEDAAKKYPAVWNTILPYLRVVAQPQQVRAAKRPSARRKSVRRKKHGTAQRTIPFRRADKPLTTAFYADSPSPASTPGKSSLPRALLFPIFSSK